MKTNVSDIMNILENVLKYHTNMDTKAPIDDVHQGRMKLFKEISQKFKKG